MGETIDEGIIEGYIPMSVVKFDFKMEMAVDENQYKYVMESSC
ncbi:hypothetical protein SPHINGO8BC_70215 [Sphingobacterium multivorum]|uniref:Uncharacterized protein n=1 Tax=Sphingobacterium multivorum TaxID=28454 RepID=A0A654DNC6_SPHMU|nr:hypothetical protein SPHINGO8BC_70215 [Sphingobacterium multivorum]